MDHNTPPALLLPRWVTVDYITLEKTALAREQQLNIMHVTKHIPTIF